MARTRKNTVSPSSITLDWTGIDADLKAGKRVSLSHLAATHKVFPIDLRRLFEARYGADIVFKRGRTGGVFWKTASGATVKSPSKATAPTAPTSAPALVTAAA